MSVGGYLYTDDFTADPGWYVSLIDCSSNDVICTIPDIATQYYGDGNRMYITRTDTVSGNTCTIVPTYPNTINGLATTTLPALSGITPSSLILYSFNSNWWVL